MSKTLIAVGVLWILLGLLWPLLGKVGLGRLPGDIVIERENFRFYLPLTSGLLISVVISAILSVLLWFLRR